MTETTDTSNEAVTNLFEDESLTNVAQPSNVWVESDLYKGSRKRSHEKELNVNYVRKSKPVQAIFGGNSGVLIKGVPYSSDGSSCIRKMMLRDEKIELPIDFRACITFAIGNAVETEVGDNYIHQGCNVVRGDRVHVTLLKGALTDDGKEFQMFDEADLMVDGIPYEIKSVSSVRAWETIFINGEPKFDNIIQAAHHMLARKIPQGKLVYVATLYHSKDKTINKVKTKHKVGAGSIKEFALHFDKAGNLFVDNKPFCGVNVIGLLAWRDWASLSVVHKDWNAPTPSYWRDLLDSGTGFKMKKDGEEINNVCMFCDWRKQCRNAMSYAHFRQTVLQDINNRSESEEGEEDNASQV